MTQHHLGLTEAQQRQMLTEGSLQAAGSGLLLYGGVRSFLRGRAPAAPKPASETVPDAPQRGLASTIGGEPIDAAEFARMKAAFEKNGGSILQNADIDAYLAWRAKQRGASNVGGVTHNAKEILLPTNVTRTAVFEEFIYTAQFRTGRVNKLIEQFGNAEAERLLEIEAAEKLIQNQRAWKLPQNEIDAVTKRLEQLRNVGGK
jgi:hypothetical protein